MGQITQWGSSMQKSFRIVAPTVDVTALFQLLGNIAAVKLSKQDNETKQF